MQRAQRQRRAGCILSWALLILLTLRLLSLTTSLMSSLISLLSLGVRSGYDSGPETAPDTKRDPSTNAATAIAWCPAIYSTVLLLRLTSNPRLLAEINTGRGAAGGMRRRFIPKNPFNYAHT